MTQPNITGRSWIMVGMLGLIWGSTFMVIEIALRGITPIWLAAGRITFAALLTGAIWGVTGFKLFGREQKTPWGPLVWISAFSTAIPFMAVNWGQQFTTSGYTGISMATAALMVLPLAHFMVPGEQMTWRKLIGVTIGFAGVVVLIGPGAFASSGVDGEFWGRLGAPFAATCYALSSVVMRRLPQVDPIGLSATTLSLGAVIVIGAAYIIEGPPPLPDRTTLWVIAVLGLIPTAAANLLRVLVIRSAGPTFMSLVNYQVPLWSVIMGVIFLNEAVTLSLFIALVLILLGIGTSQYTALKRLFGR